MAASSSSAFVRVQDMNYSPITAIHVSEQTQDNSDHRMIYLGNSLGQCFATTNDLILPELHLTSAITSIQATKDIAVYTSLGPHPQIMVRNSESSESYILRSAQLQDVRTSKLQGTSLTLGAQKKAFHIPNLDDPRETTSFHTDSDVFALHRFHHEIWTGARNGNVTLFDLRTDQRISIFDSMSSPRVVRDSVTNLYQVWENYLLVARINGEITLFDRRFLPCSHRQTPAVQSFEGHANSYLNNLAMTVDPHEEFLFAAGQDGRIRIWSLRNGQLLVPPHSGWKGLLTRKFDHNVLGLQVTNINHQKKLWLCSGSNLEYYELCKRGWFEAPSRHTFISC